MPTNVFLAAAVERALVERLAGDARFTIVDDLASAEVVVTRTNVDVSGEMLAGGPHLRLIAQGTSGIDNIDLDAAGERGIAVINLPGINANAVAELVIGQIVMLTRTVPLYHREMLAGVWNRDDCASRHELRHYTLGIVGVGNVGSRVARLANLLGMNVLGLDPYISEFGPARRVATLAELLAGSDIVTLHVPLTPETRSMIGGEAIGAMRPGTIVINASRGEVLEIEPALAALESGWLCGLALDVYSVEPPAIPWPDHPRLILTPHIAGCTFEAKSAAAERLYEAIVAFCAGSVRQ